MQVKKAIRKPRDCCGADANYQNIMGDGHTALIAASKRGNPELLKMLLEHEAVFLSTNLWDKEGRTALIFASMNGCKIWSKCGPKRR